MKGDKYETRKDGLEVWAEMLLKVLSQMETESHHVLSKKLSEKEQMKVVKVAWILDACVKELRESQ